MTVMAYDLPLSLFFCFTKLNRRVWISMNVQMFWKKNGSTILTVAGAAGLVSTTVLAVKATPKALKKIEEAEEEKGEPLTTLETIKIAAPSYTPSVLMGVGTLACIFGANILNKRQQVSLISAYAFLDNSFKEYKIKMAELYGEDADERINDAIAQDKLKKKPIAVTDDKQLYFDAYSKRFFEAKEADVLKAEAALNRIIAIDTGAYLNEWYEALGLEVTTEGYELGWSNGILESMYWTNWVDFNHSEKETLDGTKYIRIEFRQEPVIDFAAY